MSFLNIIITVKFGRKLVLVYHIHLNTKKVVDFFSQHIFVARGISARSLDHLNPNFQRFCNFPYIINNGPFKFTNAI